MRIHSLPLAVSALGLLALSACSSAPAEPAWDGTGTAVSKHHEKASTTSSGYFMNAGNGINIWVDTSSTTPERWVLDVKDATGRVHRENTARPIYERLEPGETYHR